MSDKQLVSGQLLSMPQEVWQLLLSWCTRQDLYCSIASVCKFTLQAIVTDPSLHRLAFSSLPLWLQFRTEGGLYYNAPKTWGALMDAAEPPRYAGAEPKERTNISNCGKYGSYSSVQGSTTYHSDGTVSSYTHEYESGWGADYSWGCGIYFICKGVWSLPAHLRKEALSAIERPRYGSGPKKEEKPIDPESCLFQVSIIRSLTEQPDNHSQHIPLTLSTEFPHTTPYIKLLENVDLSAKQPRQAGLENESTQGYVPTMKHLARLEAARIREEEERKKREAERQVQRERELELHRQKAAAKLARETPKKGDWNCSQCGFLNFARRDKCKNCRSGRRP